MKRLLLTLLIAMTPYALAETVTSSNICTATASEDKFVFKIGKNHEIQVCSLTEYQENGDECEDGHVGRPSWSEITDLNGDGHFDLIVSYFSGGMWRGDKPFFIFINCGNDTFVKVLEDTFTHVGTIRSAQKQGTSELTAIRAEYIGDDSYLLQRYTLKFDSKNSKYVAIPVGKKYPMTEEAENEWATRSPPDAFKKWDTFPVFNAN